MPNHCSNFLCVSGTKEEMKKFYSNISYPKGEDNPEQLIDFNDFVPMPPSLKITSGSKVSLAVKHLKGEASAEGLTESDIEQGKIHLDNIEKYGYGDWYLWSINNWGTKWNAYDCYISEISDECFTASFSTAWAPPLGVIEKMVEMFPTLSIEMEYQEEGMGFAGVMGGEQGQFYDNEGILTYNSDCCNSDVNDSDWVEYCEKNDIENWETCPSCKKECETTSEITYL